LINALNDHGANDPSREKILQSLGAEASHPGLLSRLTLILLKASIRCYLRLERLNKGQKRA
jgi:hypothetical protein